MKQMSGAVYDRAVYRGEKVRSEVCAPPYNALKVGRYSRSEYCGRKQWSIG